MQRILSTFSQTHNQYGLGKLGGRVIPRNLDQPRNQTRLAANQWRSDP